MMIGSGAPLLDPITAAFEAVSNQGHLCGPGCPRPG
jgi:hypothetical protein